MTYEMPDSITVLPYRDTSCTTVATADQSVHWGLWALLRWDWKWKNYSRLWTRGGKRTLPSQSCGGMSTMQQRLRSERKPPSKHMDYASHAKAVFCSSHSPLDAGWPMWSRWSARTGSAHPPSPMRVQEPQRSGKGWKPSAGSWWKTLYKPLLKFE